MRTKIINLKEKQEERNKLEEIKRRVDDYIDLKIKITELENELELVSKYLKDTLELDKEYIGNKGVVKLQERTTPIIDPIKTQLILKNNFVNVVTVVKKDLAKYLPEKEIDKLITEYKTTKIISYKVK